MEELSLIKQNFIHYIDSIIENNKISHSYLIEINNYDDDMTIIFDFIKMILCNLPYKEMKKSNNLIIDLIDHNNYPDIKIIEPDGSMIKKNQMIDLKKEYSNKSLLDGKRIYIIKNAEKMNASSANTILKFLEEPEEDIIAILLTDNRYHVLETIVSRCQILTIREDSMNIEDSESIIELLKLLNKPSDFFIEYHHFMDEILLDKNIAKDKFLLIEKIIVSYFNDEYGLKSSISGDLLSILSNIDDKLLLYYLSVLEEELPKLEFNVNYKLWVDSLFSRFIIGG